MGRDFGFCPFGSGFHSRDDIPVRFFFFVYIILLDPFQLLKMLGVFFLFFLSGVDLPSTDNKINWREKSHNGEKKNPKTSLTLASSWTPAEPFCLRCSDVNSIHRRQQIINRREIRDIMKPSDSQRLLSKFTGLLWGCSWSTWST